MNWELAGALFRAMGRSAHYRRDPDLSRREHEERELAAWDSRNKPMDKEYLAVRRKLARMLATDERWDELVKRNQLAY